jgi:hypothetical protein
MKVPANAIIPPEKLTGYLLLPKKSGDKSIFLARSGFDLTNSDLLMAEIRRLAGTTEATIDRADDYGEYYNVIGSLVGPLGVQLPVKLVWLRRLDSTFTFITLIPRQGLSDS